MQPNSSVRGLPPARRKARGAFTLLEVVIAMAILAFGLLTLALMQVHALTQGAAGRHTATAAAVGRSYLEQVHRVPWSVLGAAVTAGGWQNPGWASAPATLSTDVAGANGSSHAEQTYNVKWRVQNVASKPCLRDVEIRVQWQEEDRTAPKELVLSTRRYRWGGGSC